LRLEDGPGVVIAPLREEDSDALYSWINDRELVELNAPFHPVSRAVHDSWFEQIRRREDVAIFGIRLPDEDRLIGSCQLNEIDRDAGTAQVQIRIGDRSAWNQGYGTAAVRLLLRHAFERLSLRVVRLQVFADNERAIRAYEKAGFRVRPGPRRTVRIDGEEKPLIDMEARR
jgi:RimJ/RimL family protein N-acetyltransferase